MANDNMKKVGIMVVIMAFFLAAFILVSDTSATQSQNKKFSLPENSIRIADGVYDLGTKIHNGKEIQGYAFIDYRKGYHHNPNHNGGPSGGATSNCFAYFAKGAKWKTVEPYIIDTANNAGLDDSFVRDNIAFDISKWEDAADGTVDNVITKNILGDEVNGVVDAANIGNLNGNNEIMFADVSGNGALAVTIVWGIFSGPIGQRELVEWDQIYDDFDFEWSMAGEANKFDFENVASHEIGHSFGMNHPNGSCIEETMYAFASEGETKKRSLNAGDINGVKGLYN